MPVLILVQFRENRRTKMLYLFSLCFSKWDFSNDSKLSAYMVNHIAGHSFQRQGEESLPQAKTETEKWS